MADFTVRTLDECPSLGAGTFVRVREGLGLSAFGVNVERLPAGSNDHPEHDEAASGQEEVYTVLEGAATLLVAREEVPLAPGVFVRVGPSERRKIVPGPEGVVILCIGGVSDGSYTPSAPGD